MPPVVGDIDWRGKTAVLRADLNAPMANGKIADDERIRASLPTMETIVNNGGGVVCLSHLGRPQGAQPELSLRPVAEHIAKLTGKPARFAAGFDAPKPKAGEVVIMENTRFNKGEKENDTSLALRYAKLGDIFVFDAFATAHRREASVCALAEVMSPNVCAGLLVTAELRAAKTAMQNPRRPVVLVAGGAKISDKLGALQNLLPLCDNLLVGGGAANTLLAADGVNVGSSLVDAKMQNAAEDMLVKFRKKIVVVDDVVVDGVGNVAIGNVGDGAIMDIGAKTRRRYADVIAEAGTVIWSGPMGKYEDEEFSNGTRAVAVAVSESDAYTLAGGGDTVSAINNAGVGAKINHLSTGGGAFLQLLANGEMPALDALRKASKS